MADNRGGRRPGAGRKPNSGKFGLPTTVMRVPVDDKPIVLSLLEARRQQRAAPELPEGALRPAQAPTPASVPLYASRIPAGFPSPADDYVEEELDFNKLLVKNPPATFSLRVKGSSMTGAGIFDGDIIVVDRSIEARDGNVVVAECEGGYTVKRLSMRRGKTRLMPENPDFAPIEFKDGQELVIFGVVTNVVHAVK